MYPPYFSLAKPVPPREPPPPEEQVAAFLATIVPALPAELDAIERRSRAVRAVWERWPQLTASEALFLVRGLTDL